MLVWPCVSSPQAITLPLGIAATSGSLGIGSNDAEAEAVGVALPLWEGPSLTEDAVWEPTTVAVGVAPPLPHAAATMASAAARAASRNAVMAPLCVAMWASSPGVRSRFSSPLRSSAAYTQT